MINKYNKGKITHTGKVWIEIRTYNKQKKEKKRCSKEYISTVVAKNLHKVVKSANYECIIYDTCFLFEPVFLIDFSDEP